MLLQLDQPVQGEPNQLAAASAEQLASIPTFTFHKDKVGKLKKNPGLFWPIQGHHESQLLHGTLHCSLACCID